MNSRYENFSDRPQKPSKRRLEFIESGEQWASLLEMLEIAYNKCVDNTNKLNYKYIDTILSNWAGKSIHCPEQVTHEDESTTHFPRKIRILISKLL